MGKEDYRSCMAKNMGGGRLKGLSKEDRRIEFCAIAKQCSKDLPYEEAIRLCAEAASNPKPTTRKARGKCKIVAPDMAACIIETLGGTEVSLVNLTTAISRCTGQKVVKPPTEKSFLRKCVKANQVTGKLTEMQGIINKCNLEWKAQEKASEA